jgi:hypothetical protein
MQNGPTVTNLKDLPGSSKRAVECIATVRFATLLASVMLCSFREGRCPGSPPYINESGAPT